MAFNAATDLLYDKRLFEDAVSRFEAAWHGGSRPRLADHLPAEEPLRSALLAELMAIDMEFRAQRGESCSRQDYEREFPELAATPVDPRLQATQTRSPDSTASYVSREASAPEMPRAFGRYHILRELGQGAMGAVYLAHDTQLDRQVALKIPKFSGDDAADLTARFYREARASATLRHANICPVFDVGQIDAQHYITMAYIEGRPLKDYIRTEKRPALRQAASVIRKLALGMAEAHAHGVIHRDLKPANIMIDSKGEPVIMDFGLARRSSVMQSKSTQDGTLLGTPAYMSPEQVEANHKQIGPASDIYSLGVILYELLTGQLPFTGDLMTVLNKIGAEDPPPPSRLRTDLDLRLEAICLKMMARRRQDRYGSMAEAARALAGYLKSSGGHPTEDALLGNPLIAVAAASTAGSASSAGQEAPAVTQATRAASSFDPYLAWLEIPLNRRPPTHYDLLGLAPLEQDTQRIHRAAMDRLAQVRKYQLGQHADAVTNILRELSLAFDCLTHPDRKQTYDAQLRTHTPSPPVVSDEQTPVETLSNIQIEQSSPPNLNSARHHKPRRRLPFSGLFAAGAGMAGVGLLLAILTLLLGTNKVQEQVVPANVGLAKSNDVGSSPVGPAAVKPTPTPSAPAPTVSPTPPPTVTATAPALPPLALPASPPASPSAAATAATPLPGSVSQSPEPMVRYAVDFDGVDDAVDLGEWSLPAEPITFEAWATPMSEKDAILIWFSSPRWLCLEIVNKRWAMSSLGRDKIAYISSGSSDVVRNRRVHIAGTWNGKDVTQLFVDGEPQPDFFSGEVNGVSPTTKAAFIGRKQDEPRHWSGAVDGVRISRGIRYTGKFAPSETWSPDASTLALYEFKEGQAYVLNDSSSHRHHGQIVGAVWSKVQTTPVRPPRSPSDNLTRGAAEWVLARGGGLVWRVGQGSQSQLQSMGQLAVWPYYQRGDLAAAIARKTSLPEEEFQILGVWLDGQKLTAQELTQFEHSPLQILVLGTCQIDEAGMREIVKQSELRSLNLFQNWRITNDCLVHLKSLHRLEFLSLQRTAVNDGGLVHLKHIPSLQDLNLADLRISDAAMATLGELPQLEVLNCTSVNGTFASGFRSSRLKNLGVGTPYSPLTRDGLQTIASVPSLERLFLGDRSRVQSEWLSVLKNHPRLKCLVLGGTTVGDEIVEHVKAIPQLQELDISITRLTPAAVAELKKHRPSLKVLYSPAPSNAK